MSALLKAVPDYYQPSITNEAMLYHNSDRFGFFSILTSKNGIKHQHSHRLTDITKVLNLVDPANDSWISQNEFAKPNRRIVNLNKLTTLFVDVDCYKLKIDAHEALYLIQQKLDWDNLPQPSISISSGRGLQIKWLLSAPLPRHALPRWNAVQTKLVELLEKFGADHNAKDASRVLRLVDTVNTKNGATVEVLETTAGADGKPKLYDFEYLAEFFLPNATDHYDKKKQNHTLTAEEQNRIAAERDHYDKKKQNHPFTEAEQNKLAAARERREGLKLVVNNSGTKQSKSTFSGRSLAWHRVEDIRKLVAIRGGVAAGQSMATLFWSLNFLLLSGATNASQMYGEAAELCKEFGFGELKRSDELSTLYGKAKEFGAGKTITFNGKEYPQLYTPTNSLLIDTFEITSEEQRQLRTIITKDIKEARRTAKRREAGEVPRAEYLAGVEANRSSARLLKAQGLSQRAIATKLNVSVGSVNGWLK